MKVRCHLCKFEDNGFCNKKKRANKPVKIKLNKARSCSLYSEDPMKVLAQYRKREAHKAELKRQELRRVQLVQAIRQLKEEAVKREQQEQTEVIDRSESKDVG